jgi:hypothetical protein
MRDREEVRLRGVVGLALWADQEETASITTECGDEYVVKPSLRSDELMEYLDMLVEVRGRTWVERGLQVLSLWRFREVQD